VDGTLHFKCNCLMPLHFKGLSHWCVAVFVVRQVISRLRWWRISVCCEAFDIRSCRVCWWYSKHRRQPAAECCEQHLVLNRITWQS